MSSIFLSKRTAKYFKGWLLWHKIKKKEHIDYRTVVLVLSDSNRKIDDYSILHLNNFMKRKYAENAIVLCRKKQIKNVCNLTKDKDNVRVISISESKMESLYFFYCFMKFFDNIVFTYTDKPADNMLGRYLRETDINEEEAVCLALYHFRYIPSLKG